MLPRKLVARFVQVSAVSALLLALVFSFNFFTASSDGAGGYDSSEPQAGIFAGAPVANRPGRFIKVAHQADYLPARESNYLFFFWTSLKNLPADGERLVLLSKYSGEPPNISGFAIAVRRDGSIFRPVVYWGDGSKTGKWFDFPEISLQPGEWRMFALDIYKGRFLSLYSAGYLGQMNMGVKYLGGYEIDPESLNKLGQADILFGAPVGREFKGKLGPLGVLNPFKFDADEISAVLTKYVSKPEDFSSLGDKNDFKLLVVDKQNKAKAAAVVEANF